MNEKEWPPRAGPSRSPSSARAPSVANSPSTTLVAIDLGRRCRRLWMWTRRPLAPSPRTSPRLRQEPQSRLAAVAIAAVSTGLAGLRRLSCTPRNSRSPFWTTATLSTLARRHPRTRTLCSKPWIRGSMCCLRSRWRRRRPMRTPSSPPQSRRSAVAYSSA